jgi:hypothetical protein
MGDAAKYFKLRWTPVKSPPSLATQAVLASIESTPGWSRAYVSACTNRITVEWAVGYLISSSLSPPGSLLELPQNGRVPEAVWRGISENQQDQR